MSTSCRCFRPGCTFVAVVVSLIIGVITAFLRITGTITFSTLFLWVLFGVAVVLLAATLISGTRFREGCCEGLCGIITALLSGVVGTILLAIVFLNLEFAIASVIGAILTGALLFFFFLAVTSAACLVRCFFNCNN